MCVMEVVVVAPCQCLWPGGLLKSEASEAARAQFETNVFGILRMTQAFAPVLAKNGGGAFLNVLSVASWLNSGALNAYAVFVETDLTPGLDVVNVSPQSVAIDLPLTNNILTGLGERV
jgi:hypothetical protein